MFCYDKRLVERNKKELCFVFVGSLAKNAGITKSAHKIDSFLFENAHKYFSKFVHRLSSGVIQILKVSLESVWLD